MFNHRKKNYLRSERKKMAMHQWHLAFIIGKTISRISELENGIAEPTAFESIVFEFLFDRTFEDLWPRSHDVYRLLVEGRVNRLMDRLENAKVRSIRERKRASFVQRRLETLLADLPGEAD